MVSRGTLTSVARCATLALAIILATSSHQSPPVPRRAPQDQPTVPVTRAGPPACRLTG